MKCRYCGMEIEYLDRADYCDGERVGKDNEGWYDTAVGSPVCVPADGPIGEHEPGRIDN